MMPGGDSRRGRFSIAGHFIRNKPLVVIRLTRHMIILRAEYDFATERMEYTASGPMFDPVPLGSEVPWYDVEIDSLEDEVRFIRRLADPFGFIWSSTWPSNQSDQNEAKCVGCGCTDSHPCPGGCYWLAVDYEDLTGVCSSCPVSLEAWLADHPKYADFQVDP